MMIIYHTIAFAAGYVLDLLIGDPQEAPHPVRLIGKFIGFLERKWNTGSRSERIKKSRLLVFAVTGTTAAIAAALIIAAYLIHPYLGIAAEAALTYYILAARSLYDESMRVYGYLNIGDTAGARKAVSMIVGRDTDVLDDIGITKAAVETVAENTSDGVIAPMIYTAVGGPVLGMFYKAVNTMDSMVGYKNERYIDFGRAAAKLDDIVNYVPSRLSAYLMIFSCLFLGQDFSAKDAYEIHKRDSRKHASPNSAQTESACAGALGIQLAGGASYFGVVHKKPFIGDAKRPVEYKDIKCANKLMLTSAAVCAALCIAVMLAVMVLL